MRRALKKIKWIVAAPCIAIGVLFFSLIAGAASSNPSSYGSLEEYGWSTYYKYHPAKRHMDPYPYQGAIIRAGQDIPVCEEAKKPEAYLYKNEVRYIFHGKDGWLFRSADFRTDFTASPSTIEYFRRLNKALAQKGQILVIAFQPPRAMMEQRHLDPNSMPKGYDPALAKRGYEAFLRQLKEAGLNAVDISSAPAGFDYFPRGDFHWSPDGARFSAQIIADAIKNMNGYWFLKKQDFVTKAEGPAKIPTRGAFENFIQNTCKINIEMTTGKVWRTDAVADGSKTNALLDDDASNPQVTVIGTSNSAEDDKFNFVGSLKSFLHADIYNAAIVAGGFGSPGLRYFSSDEYKKSPPKFVIWEFLPQHQYNSDASAESFRQMIPAVYGACGAKQALASYSGDISELKTDLFRDMKDKPLKNAYLYLNVQNPAERNLKMNILYKNGDADKIDMTRSTRAGNNGQYYLDLAKASDKAPQFFHLVTDKAQGHINARLCQYPVNLASK